MKYFTKEFYAAERLANVYSFVRESKRAQKRDEKFYRLVYNKKCALYLYNNKSGAKGCAFDEQVYKKKFEERQKGLIALFGGLPREIRDKIADLRVFALGHASKEVMLLLRPYCAELRRTVRRVYESACAETDRAERFLTQRLWLNGCGGSAIRAIEERDGEVILRGENGCLAFRNGIILEGKEACAVFGGDTLAGGTGTIVYAELHRAEGLFETHFLVKNCSEYGEETLRYQTIRSTDICRFLT